jgi:HAE1 family hydrophobic/amphiphilic exporter-1
VRGWLPRLAVRRPVTVSIGFLALCVLGVISVVRIPLQMMPSGFTPPWMWIWVPYEVSSPLEAQEQVVRPLEDQIATLSGIKHMNTWAGEGSAYLSLEMESSVDMDEAYNEVVDRVERVRGDLPSSVERVGVYRFNPSDEPVLGLGLSIPETVEEPFRVARDVVQRKLERIPGVARVESWGIHEDKVWIEFDRERLMAHGVDMGSVMRRLGGDNFQLTGGRIEDGGRLQFVRSMARYAGLEELKNLPVGANVRLQDIATVGIHPDNDGSVLRIDGQPGASMWIYKSSESNTVGLVKEVRKTLEALEGDARMEGTRTFVFWDEGEIIGESLDNLVDTAIQGGLFAVGVLFLFLRDWRMTLLVASVIPVSLLMTVSALYFTGGTLNVLSLMGLMVAVGMVVDNAIVVVETIWNRRREGANAREAAVSGTAEVSLAILLSTLTTLVVFLPIILMSDDVMFSFFMGSLGFPVCLALAASLVAALLFSPLSTLAFQTTREVASPWMDRLSRGYKWALTGLLNHRADAVLALVLLLVATVQIPGKSVEFTEVSGEFMGDFTIHMELDQSFTHQDMLDVVDEVEGLVESHREDWGVETYRTKFRSTNGWGYTRVSLLEEIDMDAREALQEKVEELLPERPGVDLWLERDWGGDMGANSVSVSLKGDNSEVLLDLSEEVIRRMESLPGVLTADHGLEDSGTPEIRLVLDREALEEHGLTAEWVGPMVSFAMQGRQLPWLYEGDSVFEMIARFEAEDRASVEALLDFPLVSPTTGAVVPLRAVVRTEVSKGFSGIHRRNRETSLQIEAKLGGEVKNELALASIGAVLESMEFPPGYRWSRGEHDQQKAQEDATEKQALLMSVVLVFLLMGILFESFLLPFSILFTIPMALVGVAWTLWWTEDSFDQMAGIGLVVLIGVVVNNGIVLIDKVTQLRREGLPRREALSQAGQRRLRPILMTALTTVVGLMPMALGSRAIVGVPYAPLARVVVGGLLAGTVLTLFFLPLVYDALDEIRDRSRGIWRRRLGESA